MNKKTIFYLARHGETQWNIEQRIQGQLDSALTEKGQQQALQLARLCEPLNITQILTSHLGRAKQTADVCGQQLQLPINIFAGIEERDFGLWQGKQTEEMRTHPDYAEITAQVTDCKPQQGESSKQLLSRFETALKAQFDTKPDGCYLIITHGDVLRCFMSQFLACDQLTTGYDYKNCQLIPLSYDHAKRCFLPL
ncbi:putative phosphoglycerate mutase GpmB [Psychromonas marina]|uniref:Phosphoglycerate mutase GpmB n=1 Tax=Psychromonas marina TaxID=88364 RepID=A0ABQ6E306_9GAMM|nr:histidine phosphatase family protein [Psychromonas marina]GLS91381.1 putative phosphoglycerate mutase GpmB [Psychromonas marina]